MIMEHSGYRLTSDEVNTLRLLDNIPIFSGIGIHEKHLISNRCHMEKIAAHQVVIEQNDVGNDLYIIVSGKVIISKKTSYGWVRINSLSTGDFFGEIALLRNVRRIARVTTETESTFLKINRTDFLNIYKFFPKNTCDNIQLVVAKRLAAFTVL
jgi:CRP/FNR family cyclic AMP-dependent transcriptional regulator